jgi:ferredoxin-type protein NapH
VSAATTAQAAHPAAARPAHPRRFTLARRCVQSAFALLFLAAPLLALTWFGGTAIAFNVGPLDVLEPASALSGVLASGTIAAVALLGVLPFLAFTLAWGSVFCGWVCPYGFLSEGLGRLRHGKHARWSGRPWTSARLPRFATLGILLAISALAAVPLVALLAPPRLLSALPIELRALAAIPAVTGPLLLAVAAIDLAVGRRVVCRILCPVGAGSALLRAPFTWRPRFTRERCRCAGTPTCLSVCGWGLDPREMGRTDGCTACLACVEHCPSGALQLRRGTNPPPVTR